MALWFFVPVVNAQNLNRESEKNSLISVKKARFLDEIAHYEREIQNKVEKETNVWSYFRIGTYY